MSGTAKHKNSAVFLMPTVFHTIKCRAVIVLFLGYTANWSKSREISAATH